MSDKTATVAAWEALFRAQVSVLRQLTVEFPEGDLSFTEYDVLFNLSRQPGRQLRIRDLNPHLLLTQPSVSRLVDRLVAKNLVRKTTDPSDGRGTIVCLTDDGYNLFRKVAVTHIESIHQRMSTLTTKELNTLEKLTDKLRLNASRS
ncbi:MAG: MarR family transcriptional regulator [Rhodoglobus sp.]